MRLIVYSQRVLASLVSASLIFTSLSLPLAVEATPIANSGVLKNIRLPGRIGSITDSYRPDAKKVVILVQDLHLHYPTQQRILKILTHLDGEGLASGPIAIEGLQGAHDLTPLASYTEGKVKEELVDYFMQKGELSGDEAFAILRGEGKRLFGVDDGNYYKLNRELYRTTLSNRKNLQAHLGRVQEKLAVLKKKHYSRSLRRLDEIEFFDAASAADALNQKLALATTPLVRNLVEINHSLYFLNKLLRQETTLEEVRYIAQRLPQFADLTEKVLKIGNSIYQTPPGNAVMDASAIEETLKSAVDFYAVALMRDEPLAKNTLALLNRSNEQRATSNEKKLIAHRSLLSTVVMVAGGFHTAGITSEFKKAGVGYVVITPHVDDVAPEYHALYEARVAGKHVTQAEVARDLCLTATETSLKVIANIQALRPKWELAWTARHPIRTGVGVSILIGGASLLANSALPLLGAMPILASLLQGGWKSRWCR